MKEQAVVHSLRKVNLLTTKSKIFFAYALTVFLHTQVVNGWTYMEAANFSRSGLDEFDMLEESSGPVVLSTDEDGNPRHLYDTLTSSYTCKKSCIDSGKKFC